MSFAYIGTPGALIKFRCPSSLETRLEIPGQERVTLGGRATTQEAPRGHRTWSVGLSYARHMDIAGLEALAYRAYGPPPWTFIDPDMQITNLLTPEATIFGVGHPYSGALATLTADDGLPVRAAVTQATITHGTAPVIPGASVTIGVYAGGQVTLTGTWLTSTGQSTGTPMSATATATGLTRVTALGVAPTGAAAVRLTCTASSQGAPSVTWTGTPTPWTVGRGAPSVTTRGLDRAVRAAATASYLQRADMSFEVVEIGA